MPTPDSHRFWFNGPGCSLGPGILKSSLHNSNVRPTLGTVALKFYREPAASRSEGGAAAEEHQGSPAARR